MSYKPKTLLKGFAIFLVVIASPSHADFQLKEYLKLREVSETAREQLRNYFTGVGRGIFLVATRSKVNGCRMNMR